MSSRKELKQLKEQAQAQGWEVTETRNGHLCWKAPDGGLMYSSSTPSDPGGTRCHIARMKRHGFIKKK
jgi:hypothetical protein